FDEDAMDPPTRDEQVQQVEDRVAAIVEGIGEAEGPQRVVMLAGVSDSGDAGLHVAAMSGPGISEGLLTSGSTRQPGYIKSEDLFTTLMGLFWLHEDVPAGDTSGAGITVASGHGDAQERRYLFA